MKKKPKKLTRTQKEMLKMIEEDKESESLFWSSRSMLGNTWAIFYIILGGRDAGKSYDIMRLFLKDWKKNGTPFTWLRLKETSTKKLLENDAHNFVDPDLVRKFDLDLERKGFNVFDHGKEMARVLALSTFHADKGVALFDNQYNGRINVCLDEFEREKGEKNTFDITYSFIQQMENLVRDRKEGIRCFLVGNTLEEVSDLLVCFNFIPEKFGRYYIRKKRAVIDYIKPSKKYIERRTGSVGDLLGGNLSNFTNKIDVDKSLISKRNLKRPSYIIKFGKSKDEWFTCWDGRIIRQYNGEQIKAAIAMTPFIDEVFSTKYRDEIIQVYHDKGYWYRDLITQKRFTKYLMLLLHKA